MRRIFALVFLFSLLNAAIKVVSTEKFLSNAVLDGINPETGELLFMRKDRNGVYQLYVVKEDSSSPELDKKCISCSVRRAIGVDTSMIPLLNKGASDWHPSGKWFVTEMEIPGNLSWKFLRRWPGLRLLAEPGAGWWNNLFLVRYDGSLWVRLTDFSAYDLKKGVLYPRISGGGKYIVWGEKYAGAKPFDKFPYARWVLKTGELRFSSGLPSLKNVRKHALKDGSLFEPQDWWKSKKFLFASDIGYSLLPYPAYRLDIWEAEFTRGGITGLRNLTGKRNFYEEQACYSPDGQYISFMANYFDTKYMVKLYHAWKYSGKKPNKFIVKYLSTELYIMDRNGKGVKRLTFFSGMDWGNSHPIVTRSCWSRDGRKIFVSLTLRDNRTGKKTGESIYVIKIKR